jgi:hypothetical protein
MRFLRRHDQTGLAGLPVAGDERLGGLADGAGGSSTPGVPSLQARRVQDTPERLTPSYKSDQILSMMRDAGAPGERPGGGGTPFTEPVLYACMPSRWARATGRARGRPTSIRTRWSGLPFREFYDQRGVLIGAVVFEQSEHRRGDAVSGGWTLLVDLDRHWHLAWRSYVTTSAIKSLLWVGLPRGFISITGPDNSEIGTVTLEPVNEFRHPFADVPLTLQDAPGTMIGRVQRTTSTRPGTQRAILDANAVEVGRINSSKESLERDRGHSRDARSAPPLHLPT